MKQILPTRSVTGQILGKQKRKANTRYRLATHCIQIPCDEGTLLYHTLLGSLFLLGPHETLMDHEEELLREWFFVPADFNEQKQSLDVRRLARRFLPKKRVVTGFTILTTTDCNARCFYCYEKGWDRVPMSEQTARDVAAYIARMSGGNEVSLNWFGGEPLYNRSAIEIILEELRRREVPYHSSMVTNGYYLDPETAMRAKQDWHVDKIQITLDGTREVYNRTKAYIEKDENAFERVLTNVAGALKAGIKVDLRLNLDNHNADDLHKLVDELAVRFAGSEGLFVYAALLKEHVGRIHHFSTVAEETEKYLSLQKKLDEYGFSKNKVLEKEQRGNCCMADNDGHEVITPDGHIGRCDHYVTTELVGSIYDPVRDKEKIRSWKELSEPYPECDGCPLYPGCIHLKKCANAPFRCSTPRKTVNRHRLEYKVLTAYQKAKGETK